MSAPGGSLARTHEGAPGLPRGRSRLPADEVRAAQRERLVRAMVAAAAEHGYPQVTVGDVVRRARVSRTAFYAHFADKDECLLAAARDGGRQMLEHTRGAVRRLPAGTADEDVLRAGLRAFLDFLAGEPAFARLFYVELPAAGVVAQLRLQAAHRAWAGLNEQWHQRARARQPQWPALPREAFQALAGATGELVRDLVTAGHADRLPMLEDVLVALHLSVLADRRWSTTAA